MAATRSRFGIVWVASPRKSRRRPSIMVPAVGNGSGLHPAELDLADGRLPACIVRCGRMESKSEAVVASKWAGFTRPKLD